jgi:hypothetical protein
VAELVDARIRQIPRSHRVMYWHHTLLCAYQQLSFVKL